jgi:TonB dependent receptor/Carboxypeptidase regulatory-like domain
MGLTASTTRVLRLFVVFFVSFVFFAPFPLAAQETTGTLVGTVKDEQGGVLPGARVRLTSPALIVGELTTTTNDKGQFRFASLPVGSYTLEITLGDKFAVLHQTGIPIDANATLARDAILKVGATESVTVQGAQSRIEAQSSGLQTIVSYDYYRSIPIRRFSFDLIRSAAGVSPTAPSSGANSSMSVFGGGSGENIFLINGTNFTCPCSGEARAEPSIDVIDQVQLQSVGASAEFGNLQGGVFNIVTRQGSNQLKYDASYYGQPSGLTSQPVNGPVPGGTHPTSGYERIRYRDFTTNGGGPIVRNRAWFFGGYQYLRDYDSQPGADPATPRIYEQDKVFESFTWQIKPTMRFQQSAQAEFWVSSAAPTFVLPHEATLRSHATVPSATLGQFTQTLSNSTVLDARVGRFTFAQENDPSSWDTSIASHRDRTSNVRRDAPDDFGGLNLARTTGKVSLTHLRPGWAGVDHEFRIGTQIERGSHSSPAVIATGTRYIDDRDQKFRAESRAPSVHAGQFNSFALFASDSIRLNERVTINAGVRFDYNHAISPDAYFPDANGDRTSQVAEGLGSLYTWKTFSPRLGVTARLTADGRTILRSSYGRFRQGILTGEFGQFHPGLLPLKTTEYEASTGGYTRTISTVDASNLVLNPDIRGPHTDEFSIGVDHELRGDVAVAVAYVRKDGANYIGWEDIGGEYSEVTRSQKGYTYPVSLLTNGTAARRFHLTNPDGFGMTYNGMVIAAEKRRSQGWQASGSYTYSRTTGLQVTSTAAASATQTSTIAPNLTFGRDPNNLTNATGLLPNDRPHMLRVMGSVDVPRTGLAVGAHLQHVTGKPWAASVLEPTPQGDQRIMVEMRGERRLSSQTLLDFRVSRPFHWRGVGRVELLLDVLNLLNETAEESVANDNIANANFGIPTVFVDPRRAMIGVRFNLGR